MANATSSRSRLRRVPELEFLVESVGPQGRYLDGIQERLSFDSTRLSDSATLTLQDTLAATPGGIVRLVVRDNQTGEIGGTQVLLEAQRSPTRTRLTPRLA